MKVGGAAAVGLGLAAGAIVYFALARAVEHIGPGGGGGRTALALGTFFDGIPERPCSGSGSRPARVSVALLVAIFVSNLPEAIGSAVDLRAAGALLVVLVDSMIPEAPTKAGRVAGLATTLGFAVAAGLSTPTA